MLPDATTEYEVFRILGTPRIITKWRGRCDGLSEFVETCFVRLHGHTLFSGTRASAENYLNHILSGGRSPDLMHEQGAGI